MLNLDFENWTSVENARIKLEQLRTLLTVYSREYIDIPTEEFAQYAKLNHESISNLDSIMLDLVIACNDLLGKAIASAYDKARKAEQKKEAAA